MKLAVVAVLVMMGAGVAKAQLGGPAPPDPEPLRNGFLVASETVLDDLHAVSFASETVAYDVQIGTAKTAEDNLLAMAEDEREHIVADKLKAAVFAMQACRIVAVDGGDTKACMEREARAEGYAMEAMSVHREGGAWVKGAPR